ncbi:ceramide kinase-like isoform X2 [Rhinatrema bivittatum]|uniref:ceramide kinase-like isoform X2 n=1 Tax=Rhinatrema bivittatum TaxID=194408 RepID=UPI00112E65AC|nr:ceramide kinase-like isoform X2 [Rhinatrema bivittatum]
MGDTFQSLLRLKRKSYQASLGGKYLRWTEESQHRESGADQSFGIPVTEIICARLGNVEALTPSPGPLTGVNQFTVFHVKRVKREHWILETLCFTAQDSELCQQWVEALQRRIQQYGKCRPKNLLIFINPFGGKRQARKIFQTRIAPLFELAGIKSTVVETTRANQARDHILEGDLEGLDGLVCVGGDGMFSELMHGLIGRTQKEAGISENSENATLVSSSLRIGIIPAGSTDCICFATVGTNDPITSALHIIVGDTQPLDVCAVHHEGTLIKYSVSLIGYGFYGDVLADSDQHRWMGPLRYNYSGFKMVLSNRSYEGRVEFQLAENPQSDPRDQMRCRTGCLICSESSARLKEESEELQDKMLEHIESIHDSKWQAVEGSFVAVNVTGMCSACPKSPDGLSPTAHLADGTADLILVKKCSMLQFLRHLIRHTNQKDQFALPFVEVYRIKALKFTARKEEEANSILLQKGCFARVCGNQPMHSCWTCDGETVDHANISIKVHCQLINLFARGIEGGHRPSLFSC